MQHFFADRSWVQGDKIRLEGSDVNHMKNVLRMKEGEEVQVSDGTGNAYLCQIEGYEGNQAGKWVGKEPFGNSAPRFPCPAGED